MTQHKAVLAHKQKWAIYYSNPDEYGWQPTTAELQPYLEQLEKDDEYIVLFEADPTVEEHPEWNSNDCILEWKRLGFRIPFEHGGCQMIEGPEGDEGIEIWAHDSPSYYIVPARTKK